MPIGCVSSSWRFIAIAAIRSSAAAGEDLESLIARGAVIAEPIIYEDFLPVSAAGIFQSNLGGDTQQVGSGSPSQAAFEQALGTTVIDEFALYQQLQQDSLDRLFP